MQTKITLALAAFLLLGINGIAQEYPVAELYGGYSLSRQQAEANPASNRQIVSYLNGWNSQAAFNLSESFGIAVDVGQNWAQHSSSGVAGLSDPRILSYSVGPRAANRSFDPATIFVHGLFGQSRLTGREDIGGGLTMDRKLYPFTMTLGGGVDLEIANRVALRLLQIDYRLLRIESESFNGVRFGTGVVFTFN